MRGARFARPPLPEQPLDGRCAPGAAGRNRRMPAGATVVRGTGRFPRHSRCTPTRRSRCAWPSAARRSALIACIVSRAGGRVRSRACRRIRAAARRAGAACSRKTCCDWGCRHQPTSPPTCRWCAGSSLAGGRHGKDRGELRRSRRLRLRGHPLLDERRQSDEHPAPGC
jgi:hypothetical protein